MTFHFRPAVREATTLLVGLAGPSSSGKTFSALRLATGLANGEPIAVIDTESRRALHYADTFQFDYAELQAPFRPERYLEALQAAKQQGAKVIIVDSMSHEHEGPGGILEWHEEELTRMAGDDYRKREKVKFTAWIKPKRSHNLFVNAVLQLGVHVVFCFRAKPKIEMVRASGKTEVVDAGWQPICSDRFEYEMTALLMLPPNGQGVPDLSVPATKLQDQHRHAFPQGQHVNEQSGRLLGEWAAGRSTTGAPRKAAGSQPPARPEESPPPQTAASQPGAMTLMLHQLVDGSPDWFRFGQAVERAVPRLGDAEALQRFEADNDAILRNLKLQNEVLAGQIDDMLADRRSQLRESA